MTPENHFDNGARQLSRVPPHSLEAERSLVAGLFEQPAALDAVAALVSTADFFCTKERKIYQAMLRCKEDGAPLDFAAVLEHLDAGDLEYAGGPDYLRALSLETPTSGRLDYYAKLIADKALARRLIEAGSAIAVRGYEQHSDVREFAADAQRRMAAAAEHPAGAAQSTFESAPDFFAHCGERVEYLLEPYLMRASFTLISAAPKAGKTFFAAWLAQEVAAKGGPVLFVEEEGPREVLKERFAPFIGNDAAAYKSSLRIAHRKGFRLDDQRWVDLLISDAKAIGAVLIVLDPAVQLHSRDENKSTGEDGIGAVVQAIQRIIAETGATVVLVHHNKKGDSWDRTNSAEAQSSDVRGSGGWVGAADSVIQIKGVPTSERRVGEVRFYIENSDSRAAPFLRRLAVVDLVGGMTFVEPESSAAATLRDLLRLIPCLPATITVEDLRAAAGIGKAAVGIAVKLGEQTGQILRKIGKKGGLYRLENGGLSATAFSSRTQSAVRHPPQQESFPNEE